MTFKEYEGVIVDAALHKLKGCSWFRYDDLFDYICDNLNLDSMWSKILNDVAYERWHCSAEEMQNKGKDSMFATFVAVKIQDIVVENIRKGIY